MNKFAHGHADNFAVGLLCEMAGYGVPVVVVPHCKPQLASHPAFAASLETLRGMVLRVDIEELTGSGDHDETGRRAYPAASLIEQAMMGYGAPSPVDCGEEPEREPSLDFLRAQARSAYQAYQATRYDLTFNSVNKFAHGHADNFAIGLLCEMVGYGVPVVVVPHCKPQLASHPAFGASLQTLRGMGVRVLFDPDAPYERRLPPWREVIDALPVRAGAG